MVGRKPCDGGDLREFFGGFPGILREGTGGAALLDLFPQPDVCFCLGRRSHPTCFPSWALESPGRPRSLMRSRHGLRTRAQGPMWPEKLITHGFGVRFGGRLEATCKGSMLSGSLEGVKLAVQIWFSPGHPGGGGSGLPPRPAGLGTISSARPKKIQPFRGPWGRPT